MRLMYSAVVIAAAVSAAQADTAITFGFTDMAGTYSSATAQFDVTVDAVYGSSGDVTLGVGMGTAEYHPGFAAPADVSFSMAISNIMATTADGLGSFLITDGDGDTIGGVLDGTWTRRSNGFSFFDGTLSGVQISDNGAGDGSFDGPSAGGFGLTGLIGVNWNGAVSFLMPTPGGFFGTDFSRNVTLVDGILVVPLPTGAAMGMAGVGLIATRRRR